jgi:hypothetical protein
MPCISALPKPPDNKKNHDQADSCQRPKLLEQQLPIDPHRRLSVLETIVPQPAAHLAHALEVVAAIQQIFNVFRHDLCHVLELVVDLVQVCRGARVLVRLLRLLDECVEFDVGVGPAVLVEVLLRGIDVCEFGGKVGEVGKSEFARVRVVANAEEDDVVLDQIARVAVRLREPTGTQIVHTE